MTAITTPPTTHPVRDATLLLLARIDRLLAEADEVRALRDRMLAAAREAAPSAPATDERTGGGRS